MTKHSLQKDRRDMRDRRETRRWVRSGKTAFINSVR